MPYRAPVDEFRFHLENLVGFDDVAKTERFAEATSETVDAILSEAGRIATEVYAPLQRNGDVEPAKLENGVVRTSPGYADGYRALAEGGWIGLSAPEEHGGMDLPNTLAIAVNDMLSGACLSLQLCSLLSQGQIDAIAHHASQEIADLYLPKLISGEWSGTMNLTEPQAGSDVGALTTKATPNGDGTYAVTGQKIFISWGDADFLDNVCHLVLARLPDAPAGTKGISLFLVPKYLVTPEGDLGPANTLRVVSLEHKMGLHGSPTAVMSFEGATGWLIGGENKGMAAMFTMMNNARLGVAVQGVGVAEAAYQQALEYATERKQGKAARSGAIIEHADVRRTLMAMKADTHAARAIALACAVAVDMSVATGDADWEARAAFLTPIAKAFGTDVGSEVAHEGVQIHGGMGFIEETGAAQFSRDVRVTAIYEGTNGIQAADLVVRKLMDGGAAAFNILDEIECNAEDARKDHPELAQAVWNAAETLRETTEWLLEQETPDARLAGSVAYLRAFARVLGGHYHLRAVQADPEGRTTLARFYIQRMLPEHHSLLEAVRVGDADLFDLSPDDLAA